MDTMKSETTTTQLNKKLVTNNFIKLFLLSVVLLAILIYPFYGEFLPKRSSEYYKHYKTYSAIIKKRDQTIAEAIKGSAIETRITSIKSNSKKELQQYTKKKKELIAKDSILGYTSMRSLILATSQPLFSLVLSLFFLFLVIKHVKENKRYYLAVSYIFTVFSGYWFFWSLLWFSLDPKRPFDFPKVYYNLALYIIPSVLFFSSYLLFKYIKTAEEKKSRLSRKLFNQILVKNEDYVSDNKKGAYFKENLQMFKEVTE